MSKPNPPPSTTIARSTVIAEHNTNAAAGMPRVVLDAVAPVASSSHGLVFQPFYPRTYAILRKIGSTFIGGARPADAPTLDPVDDTVRAIYVMTTPLRDVKAALARGVEFLTEAAYEAVGEKFELRDVAEVGTAIAAHIAGGFSTVPGKDDAGQAGGEGGDAAPKAAPAVQPASVGSHG